MHRDVKAFVDKCQIKQIKFSAQAPAGLLQSLLIPTKVWDDLTMDFVVGLPLSHDHTILLIVVDRLTKFEHFEALPT